MRKNMCLRDEWSDRFPSFASPPSFPTFAVSCEDSIGARKTHRAVHGIQCGGSRNWPGLGCGSLTSRPQRLSITPYCQERDVKRWGSRFQMSPDRKHW